MKIGIIATYHDMAHTAQKLRKRPGVEVTISEATYEKGVQTAKEMQKDGVDVIISRGATLRNIEQQCTIPTVSCAYGPMDLIYALQTAKKFGKKIGVISGASIPVEKHIIEELFQMEITLADGYESPQQNLRRVLEMKEQGVEVVVGGSITVQEAHINGMEGVLITTRPETLESAVDEAIHLVNIIQRDRMELEEISQIIRYASDAILLTDLSGKILMKNSGAIELLNEIAGDAQVKSLKELPQMEVLLERIQTGKTYSSELYTAGETTFLCSQHPIWISGRLTGVALFCQHISSVWKMEQNIRTHLYKKPKIQYTLEAFVGESVEIKKCRQIAKIYANHDSTVLIIGESGTGKEIMAQSIHQLSGRHNHPFIAVNCNAIESTLLDSELFGYAEGAFTGAKKRGKAGIFELAHKGTVFLDEIGSVSKSLQAKLLRVLQEKEVWRIGAESPIPVDVRILAATNSDLCLKVQHGEFRLDLFYRLCVLDIRLPPLRDRAGDIQVLLRHFCGIYGLDVNVIPDNIIQEMTHYEWPGNVRELQNYVERLSLLHPYVRAEDIWRSNLRTGCRIYGARLSEGQTSDLLAVQKGSLQEMTDQLILKMYDECGQNKTALAEALDVSRVTVWKNLNRILGNDCSQN